MAKLRPNIVGGSIDQLGNLHLESGRFMPTIAVAEANRPIDNGTTTHHLRYGCLMTCFFHRLIEGGSWGRKGIKVSTSAGNCAAIVVVMGCLPGGRR
jgi:hypothetical protein